uniref:Uncharacterized protein n=1 Tax=Heterorhabditis bacteriophora TaxID=37862 RepID=A0A1I7X9S1_HETBA
MGCGIGECSDSSTEVIFTSFIYRIADVIFYFIYTQLIISGHFNHVKS